LNPQSHLAKNGSFQKTNFSIFISEPSIKFFEICKKLNITVDVSADYRRRGAHSHTNRKPQVTEKVDIFNFFGAFSKDVIIKYNNNFIKNGIY
jgi:hypothetical protein